MTSAAIATRAERLGRRLEEDLPVWVLSAPAGYGKTAAIRALLDRPHGRQVLSVAFADQGAGRASVDGSVVAERLRSAAQSLGATVPMPDLATDDRGDDGWHRWAQRSADAVRSLSGRTLLAFDDLQALTPDARETLGRFVSHVASAEHRVIVATSERLPWPVDQWQISGFADRLSIEELAYEPPEVQALLSQVDSDLIDEATELFGGWPFPVELLASRCARGASAQAVADVVHHATVVLSGAVLDGLDPSDVRVVCRVSVLDDFPAAVAEEVSGDPRAGQILEALAWHRFLVLVHGDRFAFHPLIRSILLRRFCDLDATSMRQLHEAAVSAWMDQRGHELRALHHLVEARAWTTAFQLVIDHWSEALTSQRFDLVIATIDACPRRTWANEGTVALFAAAAHLVRGNPVKAREYLRAPGIKAHPTGPIAAKLLVGHATWWATSPAAALELTNEVARMLEDLPPDVEFPAFPGMDSAVAYEIMNDFAHARALALLGEFGEARGRFMALIERPGGLRPVPEISALGTVAWIDAMTGDLAEARRLSWSALASADANGIGRDHERLAPANLAMAVCDHFDGESTAWSHVEVAARSARANGASGLARTCELVAAICGDPFFTVDDPSQPQLRPYVMPLADQVVAALQARQLLRNEQATEAADLLAQTTPHELALSAWVEVRLDRIDRAAVHRAVMMLPPPFTTRGRIERLLAEAATDPDDAVALSRAQSAAELARGYGLHRVLDGAPGPLHSRLLEIGADSSLAEAIGGDRWSSGATVDLTARELEILRLLDSPLVARQIADQLFLSEHTVKWHVARVYRKLGVTGRVGAVSRAEALGLLGHPTEAE